MIPKNNVFMVMTDYQLILALSWCNESHRNEINYILFLHRKTSLINYINLESKHIKIFPINAAEKYYKPVLISGIINELKRINNHYKCRSILKNVSTNRVYLSIEEEHFLATVIWVMKSNKNIKIFHIEEGNVVHNEQSYVLASENITSIWWIEFLKHLRTKLRTLYFGEIYLKNQIMDTYGRAGFYEYAIVLSKNNLSSKLAGKNHIQIDKNIFRRTLLDLFYFDSPLISLVYNKEKILLIVSDGEEKSNPFDSKVYKKILTDINNHATANGYLVFLKNHPLYSGYLIDLEKDIKTIAEDLPAEYYFTKWINNLVVIGGTSTSLGVSAKLGIPTYSFLDLYNEVATSQKLSNRGFLESENIKIIRQINEINL